MDIRIIIQHRKGTKRWRKYHNANIYRYEALETLTHTKSAYAISKSDWFKTRELCEIAAASYKMTEDNKFLKGFKKYHGY